jgi:hypothetical protein
MKTIATRSTRALAAAAAALLLVSLALPATAAAASVTFGTPTATSKFGTGISFSQPYTGSFADARIAITFPGDPGPSVTQVDTASGGTMTYTLDTSGGGVTPFTPIRAAFEAVLSDGSVVMGPEIKVVYADDRFSWKSATSGLVTIHWFQGSNSFAQQLLSFGTKGLDKAAKFFGTTETKPIDFYVYPSQQAFAAGLSVPETIGGQAEPFSRVCFALIAPTDLAYGSSVVPHELTHIVFSDVVSNPYHEPPRWLNEGLAVYLSEGYGSDNRQLVSQAVKKGTLAPLAALAGYFALDQARIYLSYAEAVSAVDYMVRTYGQPAIQKLLKAYAGASTDDEAFQTAFGVTVDQFDKAWMADNGVSAPTQYGPQPAPTGALPPGWTNTGGGTDAGGTQPPSGATASPGAGSSPAPGDNGSSSSSNDPTSTVMLVSAAIAALGVLLLLAAGVLAMQERNRPAS